MAEDILGKVLFSLGGDNWTVDDATKGVSIIGGTGSGKTSGSGRKLALSYLKEGWGGVVLCAKTDEVQLWQNYCKESGREKDLIIFEKNAKHKTGKYAGEEMVFNPINYELNRKGEGAGETQNINNIFMNIYRMGNRISGDGDAREERYWDSALKRCLNRVIELLKLSKQPLSYANMAKVLITSNKIDIHTFIDALIDIEAGTLDIEIDSNVNYCLNCLLMAYYNTIKQEDNISADWKNSFELVDEYFNTLMPKMESKVKSIVHESFMGLAEPFLSGLLFKHFAGETNLFPEWTYEQNKIIVVNFPIKEYLDLGIIGQSVFKLMFQQCIERRDVKKYPNPVFLWADEAQYFLNPYDQLFLTTARSARACTVFLSHNISNYYAAMGSKESAKAKVDSLMGNLCTKIFHANSDATTNDYASKLLGNDYMAIESSNIQQGSFSINQNKSLGYGMSLQPQILPKEFTTLASGGINNNYKVEAIMLVSGKKWQDGKNFTRAMFKQNFD